MGVIFLMMNTNIVYRSRNNAIQFLSGRLSCKLEHTRAVRVGSEIMQNIPILNREHYSLYGLFDQYANSYLVDSWLSQSLHSRKRLYDMQGIRSEGPIRKMKI